MLCSVCCHSHGCFSQLWCFEYAVETRVYCHCSCRDMQAEATLAWAVILRACSLSGGHVWHTEPRTSLNNLFTMRAHMCLPSPFLYFSETPNPPRSSFVPQNILLLNTKSSPTAPGTRLQRNIPITLKLSHPCCVNGFFICLFVCLFVLMQKKWAVPFSNVN